MLLRRQTLLVQRNSGRRSRSAIKSAKGYPETVHLNIDLFELKAPRDLFIEIQTAITEYHRTPNPRLFLFLVFSLNHLREWIARRSNETIRKKSEGIELSDEEKLFYRLQDMNEFLIVNELCNRSKHHRLTGGSKTSISVGFMCGSQCGDALSQKYYLIDGLDSRSIFAAVIREYHQWFEREGEQSA